MTTTNSRTARELLIALSDHYVEFAGAVRSRDPLQWPGYQERLNVDRSRCGMEESVSTARATVAGHPVVLVVFDFRFLGGSMGEATGRKITEAIRHSVAEGVPLISVTSSGGARMQEGMLSLVQMQRIAAALADARASGTPHIAVTRHPTTGGVWAALAAGADLIVSEQGAAVSFAGTRVRTNNGRSGFDSEEKLLDGFVDYVLPWSQIPTLVRRAVRLLSPATRGQPSPAPVPQTHENPGRARHAWAVVCAARDPRRQRADAYLREYFTETLPISGDRSGGRDPSMRCGFGRHSDRTIAYIAQTGTPNTAAGFRTASRLLRLASRLRLPVLSLIDTPGPANGADAERAGIGTAIAELLQDVATLPVPLTSLVIGEGGSGGGIAIAAPDNLWLTPRSYFSVIKPEAAVAILKQPPAVVTDIAERLRLTPDDLIELGLARGMAGAADGS